MTLKIALVLFGQPRFIETGQASESFKKHLGKYQVDCYGHTWIADEYIPSSWARIEGTIPAADNVTKIIKEQYPGIKLIAQKAEGFSPDINRNNTLSQFYSIEQAGKMVEPYKDSYHWIILTRWDCVLEAIDPLEDLPHTGGFFHMRDHPGYADQWLVFSSDYLGTTQMFDYVFSVRETEEFKLIEDMKQNFLRNNFDKKRIGRHFFNISLIRK